MRSPESTAPIIIFSNIFSRFGGQGELRGTKEKYHLLGAPCSRPRQFPRCLSPDSRAGQNPDGTYLVSWIWGTIPKYRFRPRK